MSCVCPPSGAHSAHRAPCRFARPQAVTRRARLRSRPPRPHVGKTQRHRTLVRPAGADILDAEEYKLIFQHCLKPGLNQKQVDQLVEPAGFVVARLAALSALLRVSK